MHTKGVWIYDLRTNMHFTLKTRQLKLTDLQDFIECYRPDNRHDRTENERFRYFTHEALVARDKASLDIFWRKDGSLDSWTTCHRRTCCSRKSSSTSRPPFNPSATWRQGWRDNCFSFVLQRITQATLLIFMCE